MQVFTGKRGTKTVLAFTARMLTAALQAASLERWKGAGIDFFVSEELHNFDHPLDPSNKYLNHWSMESDELLNVYSGSITTDLNGRAVVTLPEYFEALNQDFRYQLTPIGELAVVYIEHEISKCQFTILTDKPNVKVSWQVSGCRNDTYVRSQSFVVEEEKPATERGRYLHRRDGDGGLPIIGEIGAMFTNEPSASDRSVDITPLHSLHSAID